MKIVNEIMDLFAKRGAAAYHGEAVSQEEHALQAADARRTRGGAELARGRRPAARHRAPAGRAG